MKEDEYIEFEKEAQKWLDETDTMQFSAMELLVMFSAGKEQQIRKLKGELADAIWLVNDLYDKMNIRDDCKF